MKLVLLAVVPQLAPLVFLILATISAPVSRLYLASTTDAIFGVFGYCSTVSSDVSCSTVSIHTDIGSKLSSSTLSSTIINKLTPYLIVTPVAAGLTFVSIILNVCAVAFHSTLDATISYWVVSLIVSVLAFLTSAFVCVLSFLMFYPHVSWLGWCLIPAAAINFAVIILTAVAMKLLIGKKKTFDDIYDDGYLKTEEKNLLHDPNSTTDFDSSKDFFTRTDLQVPADLPPARTDLAQLQNSVNSTISSIKENNDFINERANTVTSSHYSASLKVPNVSNPYLDNATATDFQTSNIGYGKYAGDASASNNLGGLDNRNTERRLSDLEDMSRTSSTSSSNFTSISQRPVNPNYYTGASPKPILANQPDSNRSYANHQMAYQQGPPNQYPNPMPSAPIHNQNGHMKRPNPYISMNQRQNMNRNVMGGPLMNQGMNQGYSNRPNNNQTNQFMPSQYQANQYNPQRQQPYQNPSRNGYLNAHPQPHPHPSQNQSQSQNRAPNNASFVPMRYRNRNNMSNIPTSVLGNDSGPYGGMK